MVMRRSGRDDCVIVVGVMVVLQCGRKRAASRELRKEGAAVALAGRAVWTSPAVHVTHMLHLSRGTTSTVPSAATMLSMTPFLRLHHF